MEPAIQTPVATRAQKALEEEEKKKRKQLEATLHEEPAFFFFSREIVEYLESIIELGRTATVFEQGWLPFLVDACNDERTNIRRTAAHCMYIISSDVPADHEALLRDGFPKAVQYLLTVADDPDDSPSMLSSLYEVHVSRCVEKLEEILVLGETLDAHRSTRNMYASFLRVHHPSMLEAMKMVVECEDHRWHSRLAERCAAILNGVLFVE